MVQTRQPYSSLDWSSDRISPLGPAAVIVSNILITQQIAKHEPGMARALADAAVRNDIVAGREPLFLLVDGPQLGRRLERPVAVRGSRPRNALCPGDVSAAHGALLRVLRHVQFLAAELIRRAHVDEGAPALDMLAHVIHERANRL